MRRHLQYGIGSLVLALAILGVLVAETPPADAASPHLRIDSPIDGATNVQTPLVIEGWVDPSLNWNNVTLQVGLFSLGIEIEPEPDGRFTVVHDPLSVEWPADYSIRWIALDGWTTDGTWHETSVTIDVDMSRNDSTPPTVDWWIEGGAESATFPIRLHVDVTDYSPVRLSLDTFIGGSDPYSIWTPDVLLDFGDQGPVLEHRTVQHVFEISAEDLRRWTGGPITLTLSVDDIHILQPQSVTIPITPAYGPDDIAGVRIDTPINGTDGLEYPITVTGQVRPGAGLTLFPGTELGVRITSGPWGREVTDEIVSGEVTLNPDGSFTFTFDPRFTEGWVWRENDRFDVQLYVIEPPEADRTWEIPQVYDFRIGGERVDKYCRGYGVTVDLAAGDRPTSGHDIIMGTPFKDTIKAGAGSDLICGMGGRDTIWGGPGHDLIDAGPGKDVIKGGAGQDAIFAGAQSDKVFAGRGNDYVEGGLGDDRIMLGGGDDVAFGGPGNDSMFGLAGEDWLIGEAGDDRLVGGGGLDHLVGGEGRNWGAAGGGVDECVDGTYTGCENWPLGR